MTLQWSRGLFDIGAVARGTTLPVINENCREFETEHRLAATGDCGSVTVRCSDPAHTGRVCDTPPPKAQGSAH